MTKAGHREPGKLLDSNNYDFRIVVLADDGNKERESFGWNIVLVLLYFSFGTLNGCSDTWQIEK